MLAGLLVLAGGCARDDPAGQATVEAVTSAGQAASAPTSAPTATNDRSTTTPEASGATITGSITPAELLAVVLTPTDVGGASVQQEAAVDSPVDADHPLNDYRYCGVTPDPAGIGPGAMRLLNTKGPLDLDGIVSSTAFVADSPERAGALLDGLVAAARSCPSYEQLLAQVTNVRVEIVPDGVIVRQTISALVADVPLVTVISRHGKVVTTLELGDDSDQDRLLGLLRDRVASLGR